MTRYTATTLRIFNTLSFCIVRPFPDFTGAVFVLSIRLYPAVGVLVRKSVKDANYNGYYIPAGQTIYWSLTDGFRADSMYPNSTK